MTEVLCCILTGIITIVTVIIQVDSNKEKKKNEAERKIIELRAERRKQESLLSMQMSAATCALGLITAKKLTGQHTNGDVEAAMSEARKAKEKYDNFIKTVAANSMSEL